MTIYYSYLLSLLCLLLITHWTNTASLRSYLRSSSKWSLDRRHPPFIVNDEVTTSEPVLSRRRPQLTLDERRRRWTNDEVEIPIDVTDTFIVDNKSTIAEVKYPLLRQDSVEINQTDELTTSSIDEENSSNNKTDIEQSIENNTTENLLPLITSNEIIGINSTESEILPTNVTDIVDDLATTEIISTQTETSSIPISIKKIIGETSTISQTELSTATESNQDTAIVLLDHITISPAEKDDNQTSIALTIKTTPGYNTTELDEGINNTTLISDVVQNDTISIQDDIDNSSNISDVIQNSTEVTDQGIDNTTMILDIIENDTSTIVIDEDEYSNETIITLIKTTTKPICDRSCQCSKKCPYGFEFINETCECNPPCKSYQCFGNDTCTVTNKGKPFCRPENGSERNLPIQCYQPQDPGYHDIDMPYHNRWYYNPDENTCHSFVYRGLGGNENNFQTLHECHLQCITCAATPDPGTCLGFIRMWYYDYKKKQCSQFEYSGCKGNENKFLRKEQCVDTCITRILNL